MHLQTEKKPSKQKFNGFHFSLKQLSTLILFPSVNNGDWSEGTDTFFLYTVVNWKYYVKHLSLLGSTNVTNIKSSQKDAVDHVCNKKNTLPLLNKCQRIFFCYRHTHILLETHGIYTCTNFLTVYQKLMIHHRFKRNFKLFMATIRLNFYILNWFFQ